MLKNENSEKHLKNALEKTGLQFEIIYDDYIDYPEGNSKYHMYIIKKISIT